eukprot:350115-Chlamydomonas_euryale.AAC.1
MFYIACPQAATNTLLGHFLSLVCSLWLLNIVGEGRGLRFQVGGVGGGGGGSGSPLSSSPPSSPASASASPPWTPPADRTPA